MQTFMTIRTQPIMGSLTEVPDSRTKPQKTVMPTTAWPLVSTALWDSWRNGRIVITMKRHAIATKVDAIIRTLSLFLLITRRNPVIVRR